MKPIRVTRGRFAVAMLVLMFLCKAVSLIVGR